MLNSIFSDYNNNCKNKIKFYLSISYDDITTIFSNNTIRYKFELLRFYIQLLGSINNGIQVILSNTECKKSVIGNMTIKALSSIANISIYKVSSYIKILEDMKLIYVIHSKKYYIKDNKVIKISNIYGRYQDKEYINKYAKSLYDFKNAKDYSGQQDPALMNSDYKRKLGQRYRKLLSGTKYSCDDVEEIKNYITFENEKYRKLYNQTQREYYLTKIRDTSIFDSVCVFDI